MNSEIIIERDSDGYWIALSIINGDVHYWSELDEWHGRWTRLKSGFCQFHKEEYLCDKFKVKKEFRLGGAL